MKKKRITILLFITIFQIIPHNNLQINNKTPVSNTTSIQRTKPIRNQTSLLGYERQDESSQTVIPPQSPCETRLSVQKGNHISSNVFLTGRYWDQGNDTDGDGDYNQLVIIVEINASLEGSVNITVDLNSNISYYSWQNEMTVNVTLGIQNTSIPFEVGAVWSEKLISAYRINKTQITQGIILIDEAKSNYTTQVYSYLEFDPPKVYLTGSYWTSENINSFGYINEFYFAASFEFTYRGFYLINVSYHTVEDNYSSWILMDVFSGAGNLNIEFFLDTEALYLREINTSYSFDSISIQDAFENTIGFVYCNYTSRFYQYSEFAPPVVILTGVYSDQGIDANTNGKIDAIAILIGLDITANVYDFNIYLELTLGELKRSIQETIHLEVDNSVSLLIDTSTFRSYLTGQEVESTTFPISVIRISSLFTDIIYEEENPYITMEYFTTDFESPIIAIEGNQNFAYFANLESWEGIGTDEDPYIIEGLILNGTSFTLPIIEIRNTQVHFILRDCMLLGAEIGIRLLGVENALLTDNIYEDLDLGIELSYCAHITIDHSVFLSRNMTGIVGDQIEDIIISNNELRTTERAMRFQKAQNLSFNNNIFSSSEGWLGIELEEVYNSKVKNNTITGFEYAGIVLDTSSNNLIDFNVVIENGYAIRIFGSIPYPPYCSQGNNISNNLICANYGYGLYIKKPSSNNFIQGNIFSNEYQNGSYYAFDSGNTNLFSQNYWHELSDFFIEGGSNTDLSPLTKPPHLTAPSLIKPNGGEVITWRTTIQWLLAANVYTFDFNYSIYYSDNNGSTWQFLSDEYNPLFLLDGRVGYQYQWTINDAYVLPGSEYLIQVIAKDPFGLTVAATSNRSFTIQAPVETSPKPTPNWMSYVIFSCSAILLLVAHLLNKRREKS